MVYSHVFSNTPKLTFQVCSCLAYKAFHGCQEAGSRAVAEGLPGGSQAHTLRRRWKTGEGDPETASSTFCRLRRKVFGDLFLSMKEEYKFER